MNALRYSPFQLLLLAILLTTSACADGQAHPTRLQVSKGSIKVDVASGWGEVKEINVISEVSAEAVSSGDRLMFNERTYNVIAKGLDSAGQSDTGRRLGWASSYSRVFRRTRITLSGASDEVINGIRNGDYSVLVFVTDKFGGKEPYLMDLEN